MNAILDIVFIASVFYETPVRFNLKTGAGAGAFLVLLCDFFLFNFVNIN